MARQSCAAIEEEDDVGVSLGAPRLKLNGFGDDLVHGGSSGQLGAEEGARWPRKDTTAAMSGFRLPRDLDGEEGAGDQRRGKVSWGFQAFPGERDRGGEASRRWHGVGMLATAAS